MQAVQWGGVESNTGNLEDQAGGRGCRESATVMQEAWPEMKYQGRAVLNRRFQLPPSSEIIPPPSPYSTTPSPNSNINRSFGGLCQGQLVAGPWGDLSPHLHQLLRLFAESRVAAMGRAQHF